MADQEIERKFKIDPTRFLRWLMTFPPPWKKTNIVQYYLAGDPQVRIRSVSGEYQMCFKYPTSDPTVRDKVEWDISAELAHRLTPRATRVLIKERFRVEWGSHWWDVDCIFKEPEDVWVAEVELRSPNESFDRPLKDCPLVPVAVFPACTDGPPAPIFVLHYSGAFTAQARHVESLFHEPYECSFSCAFSTNEVDARQIGH